MTTTTPVLRGTPTSASGTGANATATPAKPTGLAAGDLLLAYVTSADPATVAGFTVTGGGGTWAKLGGGQVNTGYGAEVWFWKVVAAAGEPGSYVFATDGTDIDVSLHAFQFGTFAAIPFPAGAYAYAQNTGSSGTKTAPTATGINQGVLVAGFADVGTASTSGVTWASYTGSPALTESTDVCAAGSVYVSHATARATLAAGGATTAYTAVSSPAARRAVTAVAVVNPNVSVDYVQPFGDTAAAVDKVALGPGRVAADSAAAVDSRTAPVASLGFPRTAADGASTADVATRVQGMARGPADATRVSDRVVVELKHADLRDWEFALDTEPYVPLGRWQTIAVDKFDPGVNESRNQDQPGQGDYMTFGVDRTTPPAWGFALYTNVQNETEALGWHNLLAQAWDPAGLRDTPNSVVAMRYRVAGRTRRVYGRPRQIDPADTSILFTGRLPIAATFQLAEAVYYDDEEMKVIQSSPLADDGTVGTGWTWPVTWPLIMEQVGEPREEQIIVGGSRATWATLRFSGPSTNPWVIIGNNRYALRGSIPLGLTVEVSGLPWLRHVLRSDGAYVPDMLDPSARLSRLKLEPGAYSVMQGGVGHSGSARVEVAWRNAWHTM